MGEGGLNGLLASAKSKNLTPKKRAKEEAATACKEVTAALVEAIGSFKDLASTKVLIKLLEREEKEVVQAVCDALVVFQGEPVSKKVPIVEAIIKRFMSIASSDPSNKPGDYAPETVKTLFNFHFLDTTLRQLTGVRDLNVRMTMPQKNGSKLTLFDPYAWENWYHRHKKDKKW
jgi:hypothetical protein